MFTTHLVIPSHCPIFQQIEGTVGLASKLAKNILPVLFRKASEADDDTIGSVREAISKVAEVAPKKALNNCFMVLLKRLLKVTSTSLTWKRNLP